MPRVADPIPGKPHLMDQVISRPQRLGDSVYDAILQKLISLQIPPDGRLSVDDLARTLGVSQTPVREALTRLEAQGLVVKTHLVGYRAAPQPTQDEFEQLYVTRLLLEPYSAARAAERIREDSLEALESLLESVTVIADSGAPNIAAQQARIDTIFHRTIASESGNLVISGIMDSLQVRMQFFLLRRSGQPDARPSTIEHRQILAALRKRNPAMAEKAMRVHLERARDRYWPIKRK